MTDRLRWAILGTGAVANRFAAALNNLPGQAELLAVGSRQQATADAFADRYSIPRRYAGYENVAADPDIDIVYIGTPHIIHHRDMTLCLEAGKHVLCEKAFTLNAEEAQSVIELARRRHLFLMEAMWTRFFPVHVRVRELLATGALGEVRGLVIHHAYTAAGDPEEAYDPRTGIGAFLDQGPYAVGMACSLLGPPEAITGLATFGETGVCYQACYVSRHPAGCMATMMTSRIACNVRDAIVFGTQGKITIHDPWYKPTRMTVEIAGRSPETVEMPLNGYIGYEYEALAVMDCIRAGKIECEVMPLDETLAVMRALDALRAQWVFDDAP